MTIDRDNEPPDTKIAADFQVIVNGVHTPLDDDDPNGRDVRVAAKLNPASAYILIQVRNQGSSSVGLDDKIKLHRGEVAIFRAFESDRLFTFTLDERAWEWGAETILETELREYGEVPDDEDIVFDKEKDEVIARGAPIALKGKGAEQFVTRKAPPREVEIKVNTKAVQITRGWHTGAEIKASAIAQGVQIKPDFVLDLEGEGGATRIIGDDDRVFIRGDERFGAVDNHEDS